MKKAIFILLIIMLTGCKAKRPIIQVPIKTFERKITTLVPVFIPGDSALLRAVFECDSLNNVLLKYFNETKGSNTGSKIGFKDGVLNYRADFKPDTVYLPSDTIYTEKEVPVLVEVPKVEYRQTGFQNFLSWAGGITLLLIALWGSWKLIKRKLKPI